MNLFIVVPIFIVSVAVIGLVTLWSLVRYDLPPQARFVAALPLGVVVLAIAWLGAASGAVRDFLFLVGAAEVVVGVGGLLQTMKTLDHTGLVRRTTPLKWERR